MNSVVDYPSQLASPASSTDSRTAPSEIKDCSFTEAFVENSEAAGVIEKRHDRAKPTVDSLETLIRKLKKWLRTSQREKGGRGDEKSAKGVEAFLVGRVKSLWVYMFPNMAKLTVEQMVK